MTKQKPIRAWYCSDILIVARTKRAATRLLRERYDDIDMKRFPIEEADGQIGYCNDSGEVMGSVDGANVESVWPRECLVPDIGD